MQQPTNLCNLILNLLVWQNFSYLLLKRINYSKPFVMYEKQLKQLPKRDRQFTLLNYFSFHKVLLSFIY